MICSNQQMIAQVFGFMEDEPPVIVDWLPWNHVFGGNHDVGVCVYHGGTFYIDDGKPGPGWMEKTVRNLREISNTIYLNVPKGYDDLLPFLRADRELCKTFFRRLGLMFYAGRGFRSRSGMPTASWPTRPAASASSWPRDWVRRKPRRWRCRLPGRPTGREPSGFPCRAWN
jgi:hypothetical protein